MQRDFVVNPAHYSLPTDTIVALASARGRSGVGTIRVSGPAVPLIAQAISGQLPPPRQATLRTFKDAQGEAIDRGLVLYFPAPGSYTGEPVLELQAHGGPVVLEMLISACEVQGARRARPGEFSLRAFLNGRLDLAQAEAVADLIDAGSVAGARAALRSLSGEFSLAVSAFKNRLIALRVQIEAGIDFADEHLELEADQRLYLATESLAADLEEFTRKAQAGRMLHDGWVVVIAGRPNAGKSSLLNRLCGHDTAIVSDVPGTTRDVLRERVIIDGVPVEFIDTAGLRDNPEPIEAEGIRRARTELGRADHVFYLVDASDAAALSNASAEIQALNLSVSCSVLYTKMDQAPVPSIRFERPYVTLGISVLGADGLSALNTHLSELLQSKDRDEGTFSARARHVTSLHQSERYVANAVRLIQERAGMELIAEELSIAQAALNQVTGEFTNDDLLGEIFSSFCIGK